MRLGLNYKNGKKEVFNETDTKSIIAGINYLKLIKYIKGSKKVEGKVIKILDKDINIDELRSIEIILI
ncbi:hypothetical protein [Clostridium brassicae]|uniref:Uncharacterized protein n=1 Tax=Clostridium brassicae TaxID=2999072 RepID=A0ABT4DCF9_9CLOT|nr:hypothetical protein [Clostridium brassicae]MCY6959996.1 hypothetical protein [Clostridium brassicae]